MVTVGDILNYIESLAPGYMKMDWDNVGLLCGDKEAPVTKVLVALDPFYHVCQEAADWGAELIVTHHPLIFQPLTAVTDETEVGRCVRLLCQKGIHAINAHTNLDCAPGGVNDVLAHTLGLENVNIIDPVGIDENGVPYGLLRRGEVAELPLEDFLSEVQMALGCSGLRYVSGGRPVHKVAVGGGACASELMAVAAAGCDTFVTADVKYNSFRDAQYLGINLVDAGHYPTENPVVSALADKIAAAFPEIRVKISESHCDCVKYY